MDCMSERHGKGSISKLEDRAIESIQSEEQRGKYEIKN